MSSLTVRDSFDKIRDVIRYYRHRHNVHEYGERCVKQDIAFVTMLFNKLQMKVDEIRLSRQLQIYVDKLKPLLKSEQIQRSLKENMMKMHKASSNDTVEAQKLTIQYTAQHLGLTSVEGSGKIYISFDAKEFFLEISFADKIKVTLVNNGMLAEQATMSRALQDKDYSVFEEHLAGYISVFNIPLAPRVKPLLFKALSALEEDLLSWSGTHKQGDTLTTPLTPEAVNSSNLGYIIPSHGGIGIQILYHYNRNNMLLGNNNKTLPGNNQLLLSDSTESVIKERADSCYITVECSTSNHIPVQPLYLTRNEFVPLKPTNADYMEATFVLKLERPLVMTLSKMNTLLKQLENSNMIKQSAAQGMFLDLLFNQYRLKDRCKIEKDRCEITLEFAREKHKYYIAEDKCSAVMIHRIPFTHPSQIPVIIHTLRQQQIFNTLLLSCHTAPNSTDTSDYQTIDLMLKPPNSIECVVAHPHRNTLAVVKFDVSWNGINVSSPDTLKYSALSTVVAKYMSIPLTMHGFLRILRHHHENNIQMPPRKIVPEKTLEYEPSSALPSQPPPMSQQHIQQLHMPSMSNLTSYSIPPEPLKSLPNPPDLTSQKRKRPISSIGEQEGPKLKKPTKVVNFNEVPSIPSLSPMSSLTGVGPMKMSHQMRPIGPPSLKPAPIHPASPPPQGLTIPCLSPAPHIRPGGVPSPVRPVSSPQPGLLRMLNPQKPLLTKSVDQDDTLDTDNIHDNS